MTGIISLFLVGLFLSAFFSGSETGFYRVTRVRLVLDGLGGDPIARGLLRLTNHPSLFVATSLVGNNLANYITSLAIVLAMQRLPLGNHYVVDLIGPIVFSPIVFVYGELLPKALFFQAPNRLLKRSGPLFLLFTLLFLPVSILLWILARILQSAVGEAPLQVQMGLARKELEQVLQEGEHVGVLRPIQRQLTHAVTAIGSEAIGKFAKPLSRIAAVQENALKQDVLRMARRQRLNVVPVRDKRRGLIGYVRIIDLQLDGDANISPPREMMRLNENTSHIAALTRLQSQKEDLACVTDDQGVVVGLLYTKDLIEPLFRGD